MEDFKLSFVKNRKRLTSLAVFIILAIIVLLIPTFTSLYVLIHIIDTLLIALFAVSFNLVYGYMGELPFGHAGFFGLGAYIVVILMKFLNVNLAYAILIGICSVVLYGVFVGSLIVRLSKIYFSLCSLAFGEFIAILFWSFREVGGDVGLHLRIITIKDMILFYYVVLCVVFACVFILYKIVKSPFGLTVQAIRDNPVRAGSIGVNVARYKKLTFIISTLFVGIAGILYLILFSIVHPRFCSWAMLLNPLVGTLLGGSGSFIGPIIGTLIYYQIYWIVSENLIFWQYFTGGIIVALIAFFPYGIMGYLERRQSLKLKRIY
ncbi:MAG: branched-chain amino acid ABC transporter permease [Candidatus Bathyarchaeia archaeon]